MCSYCILEQRALHRQRFKAALFRNFGSRVSSLEAKKLKRPLCVDLSVPLGFLPGPVLQKATLATLRHAEVFIICLADVTELEDMW